MSWMLLVASGVLEAVWATALGRSQGFTEPVATVVFLVALALSMAGLGWAAKRIPIGTAYAVWVGIGAALTVGFALVTGAEDFSPLKAVFLAGIVLAVVGLKLAPARPHGRSTRTGEPEHPTSAAPDRRGVADAADSNLDSVRTRRIPAVAAERPRRRGTRDRSPTGEETS